MALGLKEHPESPSERTQRLVDSAKFWLRAATESINNADAEGALEYVRSAEQDLITLRKHLTGRNA